MKMIIADDEDMISGILYYDYLLSIVTTDPDQEANVSKAADEP